MVHHFVNLVSWSYFVRDRTIDSRISLDSISIVVISRLFGYRIKRMSGFQFYSRHFREENTIYLTAYFLPGKESQIVLPKWEYSSDIELDKSIKRIECFNNVVIGISSPKQDILGSILAKEFPLKNIYCLGAALYTEPNHTKLDKYFLNWLMLLFIQPRRTFKKIYLTIVAAVCLAINRNQRKKFRKFLYQNFDK